MKKNYERRREERKRGREEVEEKNPSPQSVALDWKLGKSAMKWITDTVINTDLAETIHSVASFSWLIYWPVLSVYFCDGYSINSNWNDDANRASNNSTPNCIGFVR